MTTGDLNLFLEYAYDADNWSGRPLVGGNVKHSYAENGHLTNLKKAGLLTTWTDEGLVWIRFTEAGKALAEEHGITIYDL
jgi:hypothetical protein